MPATLTLIYQPISNLDTRAVNNKHWSEQNAKQIIDAMIKVTEGTFTGLTLASQRGYLEAVMTPLLTQFPVLNSVFSDPNTKLAILNTLLFAKYALIYKNRNDTLNQNVYVEKFKASIASLDPKTIQQLLTELLEQQNFLGALPLAFTQIAREDRNLDRFGFSELICHRAAYILALAKTSYERLAIVDKSNKSLASFRVESVSIPEDRNDPIFRKDQALLINLLFSEGIKAPIVYITWAGTCNKATQEADLERTPGEESYRRSEDLIMRKIAGSIAEFARSCNKPVSVETSGHSLGAAFAQMCFHSLQRVIALSNPKVADEVAQLEKSFRAAYRHIMNASIPSLNGIHLLPGQVRSLAVSAWNAPGVLAPVAKYSNELAPLLNRFGIKPKGLFGIVGGDLVETTGEGKVLSDVRTNQAYVDLFKVKSASSVTGTILGVIGGATGGYLAGTVLGTPIIGALVGELIDDDAALINAVNSHTTQFFKSDQRPGISYQILSTHNSQGAENIKDVLLQISVDLQYQSYLADRLLMAVSAWNRKGESSRRDRLQLLDGIFEAKLQHSKGDMVQILHLLFSEIQQQMPGYQDRIISAIEEMPGLLNCKDQHHKCLLITSLEQDEVDYGFCSVLLNQPGINTNSSDEHNNFPFLCFMIAINTTKPQPATTYQFGITLLKQTDPKLLTQPNRSGISVKGLYDNWGFTYNARELSSALQAQLSSNTTPTIDKTKYSAYFS